MSGEEITVEVTHETKLSLLTDGIYWDDTSSQLSAVAIFHRIAVGSRKLGQVDDISPNLNGCKGWFEQHLSRIIHRLNDLI